MSYIMVDIESDGPIPRDYSMVSFGAVIVDDAKGNAEALLTMKNEMGLSINLK